MVNSPCCINGVIGDGRLMLAVTPLATPLNVYFVRVDSSWSKLPDLHDVIDDVYDVILEEHPSVEQDFDCGIAWTIKAVHDGKRWKRRRGGAY